MVSQGQTNFYTQYYQVGGDLSLNAPTYVVREADEQLEKRLKAGDFCYVLNSRQMGKSSLGVHIKQKLEKQNYVCIYIDLSGIGLGTLEQWYNAIANRLAKGFRPYLQVNWREWWEQQYFVSPIERLNLFIDEVILPSVPQDKKIVIFLDEIDSVRVLKFSCDQFFILIRSFYNQRSKNPDYHRLNFCLLGVATPSDLIEDKQVTPFNIGIAITLKGFTLDEVKPLIVGLENRVENPKKVMKEILFWTGGQPFLTQRVCDLVVNQGNSIPNVSSLVYNNIIDNWDNSEQDKKDHLRTIRNRILRNDQATGDRLKLYKNILIKGKKEIINCEEEEQLALSGLITKKNNYYKVANRIYQMIFNEQWIELNYKRWSDEQLFKNKKQVKILIDTSLSMQSYYKININHQYFSYDNSYLITRIENDIQDLFFDKRLSFVSDCITVNSFNYYKDDNNHHLKLSKEESNQIKGKIKKYIQENCCTGATYITPSFKKLLNESQKAVDSISNIKGFIFIIYTDGQIVDRSEFLNLLEEMSFYFDERITVQIVMIGINFTKNSHISTEFYEFVQSFYPNFSFELMDKTHEQKIAKFIFKE